MVILFVIYLCTGFAGKDRRDGSRGAGESVSHSLL